MMNTCKILFVIPSLSGGGAERFLTKILRNIDRKMFDIQLAIGKREGPFLKLIPDDIPLYELGASRTRYAIPALWHLVRRIKPNILFATLGLNMACAIVKQLMKDAPKLVVRVATYPTFNSMSSHPIITNQVQKFSYSKSDRIIALTEKMKRRLCELYNIPHSKVRVICNPIDIEDVKAQACQPVDHSWFSENIPIVIGAGRLAPQKGFATLLRAFNIVRREIHARLVILGEGKERSILEALSKKLTIQDDCLFPGFQLNPYSYIARATVFVLSSYWEGFPNVLLEAMACGTPVIATRCDSGPEEILDHEVNGLLVPIGGEQALAKSMIRILEDAELRNCLRKNARVRLKDFEIGRIMHAYEYEFCQLLEENYDKSVN